MAKKQLNPVRRQRIVAVLRAEVMGCDLVEDKPNMCMRVCGVIDNDKKEAEVIEMGSIPLASWYQMSDEERSMVVGKLKFDT